MRQRLALVAVEQNDVAGLGLPLAQVQAQADPIHLAGSLPPLYLCQGRRQRNFSQRLGSCEPPNS